MKFQKLFKLLLALWLLYFSFFIFKWEYSVEPEINLVDFHDTIEFNTRENQWNMWNAYQNCLVDVNLEVSSEELDKLIQETTNYISRYRASVKMEDLTYGYTYTYNPSKIYYGASTIKALEALYIYTKASEGKINLDDTVYYSSEYGYSLSGMRSGTKIPLRTIVKNAVEISDNAAHFMLINYIGFNNLKNFGQSLGATSTLTGGDTFGNLTATDGIIYMKALYDFIENNGELGQELKQYFINSDLNAFKIDDLGIEAAAKYGEIAPNFHEIGIVYTEHPYVVSILTTEMTSTEDNVKEKVQDIARKLYELQQGYYEARDTTCRIKIYGI